VREDENELPKKILWTNPGGKRGRGRTKSSWIDEVKEEARKMGCRNRLAAAQDRGRWRGQGQFRTVEPKMMMMIMMVMMMKNQKKEYLQGEINQLGTYCRTRIIETCRTGGSMNE